MNTFFSSFFTVSALVFLCLHAGRVFSQESGVSSSQAVDGPPSGSSRSASEFRLASLNLIYEKPEEEAESSPDKKKAETYNVSGGFRQIFGFIESADRISQIFVSGSARFQESYSASFSQSLNFHYYNREPNRTGLLGEHFRFQDSLLYLTRTDKLPYGNSLKTGLSFSLPISDISWRNGELTEATASLNWSFQFDSLLKRAGEGGIKPAWLKNITIFASGLGRYYLSRWNTTPTKRQSFGGRPLPEFLFGVRQTGLSFNVTDYVSFSGTAGGWLIYPHKTYRRDRHSPYRGRGYYPRLMYMFSFSSAFQLKPWTAAFSYFHIDRMDKQGRRQILLFDDRRSTWSLSVSYAFSFDSL